EGTLGDIENRAATSCGHIYGKTKISAESNTCSGKAFSRYPATIKQRGDRFFAEGINNTLLHVFISQPYEDKNPGINAWFGNEFNRKNTWFSQIDLYTQYLKRTNFMLQQGLNVADVAYFIGEDAPKMTGITDPALPIGYQFDYINAEVIEKFATVSNGLITLPSGTQYKILVLPKQETMRPELLSKIKSMVLQGAVILGPAPKRSPSLQNQPIADRQVSAMAKEIWGKVDGVKIKQGKYGKGTVLNGLTMEQAFGLINNLPDCQLPRDSTIHFGHRRLAEGEIYFLTNQTSKTQVISPSFRVTGMQPELWEATTGYIRPLPSFEQNTNATTIPLQLAPYESVFIVFRKATHNSTSLNLAINYPAPSSKEELKGPWKVIFDTAQRGPQGEVIFNTLQDWSIASDERIKYYSGTAVYQQAFQLPLQHAGEKVLIDLGVVSAMAKVKVNGAYVGGVWTPPYRLDISKFVTKGVNLLEIEVVNTWVNRLIGDSKLPKEQRKTWCSVNPYQPNSPLQPSGLLGPVMLLKQ
ncbi:MAG: glycoside hydrolase family 2, partial [Sediminibacterium sp.]|nr:glycoside hydrolase family 2 [Sediminibacterium sp.]